MWLEKNEKVLNRRDHSWGGVDINHQILNPSNFEKLPKVELHVHLEGAIPRDALWALIHKYHGDSSIPDWDAFIRRFRYKNFSQFIETWVWKNKFIREYEDFTYIANAVAQDMVRQNIKYAEIFFSPSDFNHREMTPQRIGEAIRKGFDTVKGIETVLIADLVRDFGPQNAEKVLNDIKEIKDLGVTGIGIGGSEKKFPPDLFKEVFEQARQYGFHTSAHAGEADGPKSIWSALCDLRVDRIGHGVRAIEDKNLVNYLVANHIPLEICPISNVKTGVVNSYLDHPVRKYFDHGIFMSINTDDPTMFGNSLALEYSKLATFHGFSRYEIKHLILQGINMAWMPDSEKKRLTAQFKNSREWLD